jgi:hypothetical protein
LRLAPGFAALLAASAALLAFGGRREPPDPREAEHGGSSAATDRPSGPEDPEALRGLRASLAPDAEESSDDDTSGEGDPDDEPGDDDPSLDDEGADAERGGMWLAEGDAGKRHKRARGGCPSNMARVREFCVDRYEAPNRRGAKPLAMQSANDAVAWCSAHNKRLCTEDEWIGTCEGDEHRAYPYGREHVDSRCNDDKPWKQVSESTLAKWPALEARAHARELYQATPSGWKHKCSSDTGVRDLTGNVEEWVVRTRDHANDWPYVLIGCYWSGCYGGGKPTCRSTNDAHGPDFRFYETGFRCCRDAALKR